MTAPTIPALDDVQVPEGPKVLQLLKSGRSYGKPRRAGDRLSAEEAFFTWGIGVEAATEGAALAHFRTMSERGWLLVLEPGALPEAWRKVAPLVADFRRQKSAAETLDREARILAEHRRTQPAREANEARLRADAERERLRAEWGRVRAQQLEEEAEQARQQEAARRQAEVERAKADILAGKVGV